MRRAAILTVLLLSGCESDEAKLRRLELEVAIASMGVRSLERSAEDAEGEFYRLYVAQSPDLVAAREQAAARADAIRDSIPEARRRLTLAERDLRAFLGY